MSEKLLFAVMVAMPLIGIRIIYAIAIAITFKDHSASGGSMAVRVIFGTSYPRVLGHD